MTNSTPYCSVVTIQYFFGYKTVFFLENNPKNLDQSYKTDLDLWDCYERVGLIKFFVVILERGSSAL